MTQLADVIGMPGGVRSYEGKEDHRWPYLFGVELELESVRTEGGSRTGVTTPSGWTVHNDASLREGLEFVTDEPVGGIALDRTIRNFYDRNFTYTNGPRTSTHIHVNMSDATVEELRAMVVLVYTIEDAIYATTEEARKWGGYSVALSEMRPVRLRNILNAPNNRQFVQHVMPSRNNERYYGFNVNVSKHGTVEFRYFPGGPTQEELRSWIDLVSLIRTASKKYTVAQMIERIDSVAALEGFIRENLGEWAERLISSRGIDEMYSNFEAITAMATDEDNPERAGGIVVVSPSLLKFVNVTLLDNNLEALTYMKESLPRAGILSEGDWKYFLSNASLMSRRAARNAAAEMAPQRQHDPEDDPYFDPEEDEEDEGNDNAPRREVPPSAYLDWSINPFADASPTTPPPVSRANLQSMLNNATPYDVGVRNTARPTPTASPYYSTSRSTPPRSVSDTYEMALSRARELDEARRQRTMLELQELQRSAEQEQLRQERQRATDLEVQRLIAARRSRTSNF